MLRGPGPKNRIIVVEVDDVLLPYSAEVQVSPPRKAYYPESVKNLLEFVKRNSNVMLVLVSQYSTGEEIYSAVNALSPCNHPNIKIYSLKELRANSPVSTTQSSLTNALLNALDSLRRMQHTDNQNIIFVSNSLEKLQKIYLDYRIPIYVPFFLEEGSTDKYHVASSNYLDCLPVLALLPEADLNKFAIEVMNNIKINKSDDRANALNVIYEGAILQQLTNPHIELTEHTLAFFREKFSTAKEDVLYHQLKIRAENYVNNINKANSFDDLNYYYVLLQREKKMLRQHFGFNKLFSEEGNTNRWNSVVTALQKNAWRIAESDLKNITTLAYLRHFRDNKEGLYMAIFNMPTEKNLFAAQFKDVFETALTAKANQINSLAKLRSSE